MNTVTISTEDGTELSFTLTDDTDRTKAEGMEVGSTLVVTYTGEITDTDTSAAVVTALEITAAPEGDASSDAAASDAASSEASQEPSSESSEAEAASSESAAA